MPPVIVGSGPRAPLKVTVAAAAVPVTLKMLVLKVARRPRAFWMLVWRVPGAVLKVMAAVVSPLK